MNELKNQETIDKIKKVVEKYNKEYPKSQVKFNYDDLKILLDGIDISAAEIDTYIGGRAGNNSAISIKNNDKQIVYGDFFMYRELKPNGDVKYELDFPYPPIITVIDYSRGMPGVMLRAVPNVEDIHTEKERAAVCNKIARMGINWVLSQKSIKLTDEDLEYYNLPKNSQDKEQIVKDVNEYEKHPELKAYREAAAKREEHQRVELDARKKVNEEKNQAWVESAMKSQEKREHESTTLEQMKLQITALQSVKALGINLSEEQETLMKNIARFIKANNIATEHQNSEGMDENFRILMQEYYQEQEEIAKRSK